MINQIDCFPYNSLFCNIFADYWNMSFYFVSSDAASSFLRFLIDFKPVPRVKVMFCFFSNQVRLLLYFLRKSITEQIFKGLQLQLCSLPFSLCILATDETVTIDLFWNTKDREDTIPVQEHLQSSQFMLNQSYQTTHITVIYFQVKVFDMFTLPLESFKFRNSQPDMFFYIYTF